MNVEPPYRPFTQEEYDLALSRGRAPTPELLSVTYIPSSIYVFLDNSLVDSEAPHD